jgi:hypothetical protein
MYNLTQYKSRANTILQRCAEIEKLQEKRLVIEKSEYYHTFGTQGEQMRDLIQIDREIEVELNILKCLV